MQRILLLSEAPVNLMILLKLCLLSIQEVSFFFPEKIDFYFPFAFETQHFHSLQAVILIITVSDFFLLESVVDDCRKTVLVKLRSNLRNKVPKEENLLYEERKNTLMTLYIFFWFMSNC